MAREQAELKARIDAETEGLRDNFEEIKHRVKDAMDVSVWYRRNTALALGGAAAGGLVLSLLLSRGNDSARHFTSGPEVEGLPFDDQLGGARRPSRSSHFRDVIDNSVTAALGVAEDRLQDFLSDLIPGYREHYARGVRAPERDDL